MSGATNSAETKAFEVELAALLNRHSMENGSNTPDFILAGFLRDCLRAFDEAVPWRDRLRSRESSTPSADEAMRAAEERGYLRGAAEGRERGAGEGREAALREAEEQAKELSYGGSPGALFSVGFMTCHAAVLTMLSALRSRESSAGTTAAKRQARADALDGAALLALEQEQA